MGQTPIYALRYPEPGDPPDVPTDMHELALDVETIFAEISYTQVTSNVTLPDPTAAAFIGPGSLTFVAQPIMIEFYCSAVNVGAGANVILSLHDGATDLGILAQFVNPGASALLVPALVRRRLTPTAGAHDYQIWGGKTGGASTLQAGAGGAGAYLPIYMRINRA